MPYVIPQNPPSLIPAGDLAFQAGAASGQAKAAELLAETLARSRAAVGANAQAMGSLGGPRTTILQTALMEQDRRRKAQAERAAADLEHRQRQMTWERDRAAQIEDEQRKRAEKLEDEQRERTIQEQDPVWIEQRRIAKEATGRAKAREAIERLAPRIAQFMPVAGKAMAKKAREKAEGLAMSPEEEARWRIGRRAEAEKARADAADPVARAAREAAEESISRRALRQALEEIAPRFANVPFVGGAATRELQGRAESLTGSPEEAAKERRRQDETIARAQKQEVDAKVQAEAARRSAGVKMAQDFAQAQQKVAMERGPKPQAERTAQVARVANDELYQLMRMEKMNMAGDSMEPESVVIPEARLAELRAEALETAEGVVPPLQDFGPRVTPGMRALVEQERAQPGYIANIVKAITSFDPDTIEALAEIAVTYEDLARILQTRSDLQVGDK